MKKSAIIYVNLHTKFPLFRAAKRNEAKNVKWQNETIGKSSRKILGFVEITYAIIRQHVAGVQYGILGASHL